MFKSILLIAVSFAVSESQLASAPQRVRGDNAIVGGQSDALFGRRKSNLRNSNKERDLQVASMSMSMPEPDEPEEETTYWPTYSPTSEEIIEEVSEGIEPTSSCEFPILCDYIPMIGLYVDCTSC